MRREDRFNRGELKALGRRLRLLCIARGWSLKKLSELSDVSIAAIRKVEVGESNPSLLTVLALVEALDEPVDRLISEVVGKRDSVQVVSAPDAESGKSVALLSDRLTDPKMTGRRVALGPGEALAASARPPNRPMFGYVLDGEVVLTRSNGCEDKCRSGDAFHIFDPARDRVSGAARGARIVVVEQARGA